MCEHCDPIWQVTLRNSRSRRSSRRGLHSASALKIKKELAHCFVKNVFWASCCAYCFAVLSYNEHNNVSADLVSVYVFFRFGCCSYLPYCRITLNWLIDLREIDEKASYKVSCSTSIIRLSSGPPSEYDRVRASVNMRTLSPADCSADIFIRQRITRRNIMIDVEPLIEAWL